MKVSDLIIELNKFDQNLIVAVYDDGMTMDISDLEIEKQYYPEMTDRLVIS